MSIVLDIIDGPPPMPEQDGYLYIRRVELVVGRGYTLDVEDTVVEEKIPFKDMKGWKMQFGCIWIFMPSQGHVRMIPSSGIIEIKAYFNSPEYVASTPEPHDNAITCVWCAGVLRG